MTPLLSVITVVRNGERDIGATLESVCAFHADDVEIVVVDGASTDSTLAVAQGFASRIDTLVSEPDEGIYDAMNKGIRLARGRFVLHVNAGDRLIRVPRAELAAAPEGIAALSFPVRYADQPDFVPGTGWRQKITNTLHHQGTCYRRTPSLQYDRAFPTYADFDFNQRNLHAGNVLCLPGAIAWHTPDGVSNRRDRAPELFAIIRRNEGAAWVLVSWLHFKVRGLQWRLKKLFRS